MSEIYKPVGQRQLNAKIQFLLDELNRLYGLNQDLAEQNEAILRERTSLQNAIRALNEAYLNCLRNQ